MKKSVVRFVLLPLVGAAARSRKWRATAAGLTAAGALALVTLTAPLASAAPPAESGPAARCPATSGGPGSTYFTVTCTSGPPGATAYASYIECSNGGAYYGPPVRYSPSLWSEADCPGGSRVTYAGAAHLAR